VTGSVSFDRAAEYYDATRRTDPQVLRAIIDVLGSELGHRGRTLEVGVGTGVLALPLARRGVEVVGVDISAAMMAKLRAKASGRTSMQLVRADAADLPFRDASFGGAYIRWVLHLIPRWRDALVEMCRVVRSEGVVVAEPGGSIGAWQDLLARFREEVGEAASPVGLDNLRNPDEIDQVFADLGAARRELPRMSHPNTATVQEFLEETAERRHSWTWRIPDEQLRRAVESVRRWAEERYGDLNVGLGGSFDLTWRAYDLP
jgi:SAM-dependent methyltransferase